MSHWISFPGLGIEPFELNRVAFTIFGRDIVWYALIICLGMILGVSYATKKVKDYGVDPDTFLDMMLFTIPIGIVGARAYFVIMEFERFDSFMEMIAIWNGGLAIYGGIIAGLITILIFVKIKKLDLLTILDAAAPGVMIGQMIGRWGNFTNAEAHGGLTDLPWRMGIAYSEGGEAMYVHPTFLYESLWNLVGFLLIHFLISKIKKFNGTVFCFYLGWYGFGRSLIEQLRTDSLYIDLFGNEMRVSALVGTLSVVASVVLFFVLRAKAKETESAESYAEIFTQPKMPYDISNGEASREKAPEDIIIEENNTDPSEDKKAEAEEE